MNSPSAPTPEYFTKYRNFALSRSPSGVLTVRFHTDGGPATFTGTLHSDFPLLLEDIAFDRDNHVLILTGNGGVFMTDIDGPSLGDLTKAMAFGVGYAEGRRVLQRLVDLEMPIVAAVNGPAAVHSEYVLLGDIVVASQTTTFSDLPHLTFGIVPGDGLQVVWEEVLGLNRARYLTLTQRAFTAEQALAWGAVAEVVPRRRARPRRGARRDAGRPPPAPQPLPRHRPPPADQPPDGRRHRPRDGALRTDRRQPRLPQLGQGAPQSVPGAARMGGRRQLPAIAVT
jgi:enoyl-CoA hydratase/carnithine racemase